LKDVRVESIEYGPSFVIEFTFDANPFFEETALKKTYFLKQGSFGDVLFNSAKGTDIHWKAGKNLTVEIISKTTGGGKGRRGKGASRQQPRTIKVEQPCESFFNFFNPDAFNSLGGEDELEDEELEALYQSDYELGAAIKEEIIPSAVLWYTGEADIPEYEDGEEDDDGEDDEDDDDGEDDDGGREGAAEEYNSEEDEDFTPPPPGQEQQPECKQQ